LNLPDSTDLLSVMPAVASESFDSLVGTVADVSGESADRAAASVLCLAYGFSMNEVLLMSSLTRSRIRYSLKKARESCRDFFQGYYLI